MKKQNLYKVVYSNNFNERTTYYYEDGYLHKYVEKQRAEETAEYLRGEGYFKDIEVVPLH